MTDVSSPALLEVFTPALGRTVYLREGTSDQQVWGDCFSGLYHLPDESMEPPRFCLDLGANIGLAAAHYEFMWPHAHILAVEMDPDSAGMINRNAPTVDVGNYAVSANGGWGTYDPDGEEHGFAFTPEGESGRMVASYRLRQVIKRNFMEGRVDFCKMDLEGACWAMFAHDLIVAPHQRWSPLIVNLLVELHERNAPEPPSGPWPEGRDGQSPLLAAAVPLLEALGYEATPRLDHPASVWAVRR